ncbi:MAG TPA: hypothetical protein PKC91_15040 [Ignavibacteria bacterium]|nr:hypothetical protein [Ignavibacteria bacterium]
MKKLQLQFVLLIFLTFIFCGTAFSANEQFRSIAAGDWNATTTWEMSTNGGGTWFAATSTPRDTSGAITVRSPNTVTVTVNVSVDQLTVNTGGILSINAGITLTLLNGSGDDFTVFTGGIVTGTGTFQTQGAGTEMNLRNGSNFNVALKINSGTTTVNDQSSPFIGKVFGPVTVDVGATLTAGNGGYTLEVHNVVTNNGTIAGTGGASFALSGSSLVNNSSITAQNFRMDTTSNISGAGSFTNTTVTINTSGNISLLSNVTFSPSTSFTINTGGILNLNTRTFTFTSGSFVVMNGGTVLNSGLFQTQGTTSMNLRNGSSFNAPLKVNSGTTTANEISSPFTGRLFGSVTVDNGATLTVGSGGYFLEVYGVVVNNGIIAAAGSATFVLRGPSLVNTGSFTAQNFRMDSTSNISGTGTFTGSTITISGAGNITLSSNVTFSPTSAFNINTGGTLNPNSNMFTITSGTFAVQSGGTVTNSGTVRTQGTILLNLRGGSNFNAPLKVNTGTTTANDQSSPFIGRLYGTLTVDAGAVLSVGTGTYVLEAHKSVINNGAITGVISVQFILKGPSLENNGSMNPPVFRMDTTSTITGAGTFTGSNITINNSGNITMLSNITFSTSTVNINTGGIINPNSNTFTITSGTFTTFTGSTVSNSGLVQTQGTVQLNIRGGSSFNAPLKVNNGTTTANDQSSPFTGRLYGEITVDNGATLSAGIGGYFLEVFSNVTNNGTIAGSSNATLRFVGTIGAQTLQGNGIITVSSVLVSGAIVNLTTNHQFFSMVVNTGTSFNIGSNYVKFSATTPLTVNGTFTNTNSKIEYNGTIMQTVPTINVNYYTLRINNPASAILSGNISIPDSLNIILGDLDLNGKIITISSTGYMTETPGNTVKGNTGYITTTRNINSPSGLNVAGMGAVLTQASNLGSTEVRRGHTVQTGLNGGTSIRRYYDITPTNNSGLNATFVFKFDDSELNGKPEPSLKLFKSTNSGSTWLFQGGTVNIAANTITLPGITSFSRWSADSSGVSAAIGLIMEGFYNIATNNLNMTDTVRAYLRNTSSPYAVVDSAVGLLDSLTYKSAFQFTNATTGTYYIQLKHRNSLETWSKNGVNYIQDSTLNYDFTFAATQAYGNNEILKGTKYCLYSGDVTQDGSIDLTDVLQTYNASSSFAAGYVVTDVNGNSIVDLTDILIAYNNSTNFISKKTP